MTAIHEELRELKGLLDQGVITQQEFEFKKNEILARGTTTVPQGSKSRITAGLLAIFLGALGIHKFYLGYTKAGIIMVLVSVLGALLIGLGPAIMAIIGIIEGVMYLAKSDQQFYDIYVVGDKPWF